jgi:anti-anti-sigma factor
LRKLIRPAAHVILSLRGVTYLDTAGIAVFVEASGWAKGSDVCFSLSNVSEAATAALQVVRLDSFFQV